MTKNILPILEILKELRGDSHNYDQLSIEIEDPESVKQSETDKRNRDDSVDFEVGSKYEC